ncbi:MAG: hypothetical protein HYX24_05960 [Candidatus Aenigmarchaeota archaeon]|nr:hypothetical protein [Candidatus Aenigmarchaeota archaeon]
METLTAVLLATALLLLLPFLSALAFYLKWKKELGKDRTWTKVLIIFCFVLLLEIIIILYPNYWFAYPLLAFLAGGVVLAFLFNLAFRRRFKEERRKAISMAIIVFLLILGVAFLIYVFLASIIDGSPTTDQLQLPEALTYCQYGTIEAYATTTDEMLNADRIIIKDLIDSNGVRTDLNLVTANFPLKRGQQAKKIIDYNCGSSCNGTRTLVIGTSTMRVTRPITCS